MDGQTKCNKKKQQQRVLYRYKLTDTDTEQLVAGGAVGYVGVAMCEQDSCKLENGTRHFDKHLQTH